MTDSINAMLAYLKSGRHRKTYTRNPITLGPKSFASHIAAYRYVKQMVLSQEPGVMFHGDDLAIILAVIKRHPGFNVWLRKFNGSVDLWEQHFIGFTVRPHVGSQMLTGLVPRDDGRPGTTHHDISVDRCFNIDKRLLYAPKVTKSVYRQDEAA